MTRPRTWVVVGSSPAAHDDWKWLRRRWSRTWTLITANAGLLIAPDPHWLVIIDETAQRLFAAEIAWAREGGAITVAANWTHRTPHPNAKNANARCRRGGDPAGVDRPNVVIVMDKPVRGRIMEHGPDEWSPGTYVHGWTTGSIMMQVAANHGAQRIVVVGCDGYASREAAIVPDTFDGRDGPGHGALRTAAWYAPVVRSVIRNTPGIVWSFVRAPKYPLADVRERVEIMRSAGD